MSKKCRAYSESRLGLEPSDNRKAFYAGWDAAIREALANHIGDANKMEKPREMQVIAGRKVTIDWKTQALELRELVRLGGIKIYELEKALVEQPTQQALEHCIWARNGNTPCPHVHPRKPWAGLTDEEWMNIVNKNHAWFGQRPEDVAHEVVKLVETKLKEKNT